MEIHAPDKPILSVKEAAVHLLIVTVGILIALSFEGMIEYAHHRTIVREAREIMRSEIEANAKDLGETMTRLKLQTGDLEHGIDLFAALSRGEKVKPANLPYMLSYRTAQLHQAARTTAELMGAFALMDYRDVSRYAAVYDMQERFTAQQTNALAVGTSAFAWTTRRKALEASASEAAVFTERLRETLGALTVTRQFGEGLQRRYKEFLDGK